ncbi:MAG TPA: PKD domain-containing protein, partial [Candidatus Thermoplasmatota archaeon]|nr:PKD domain-containing protein [Candidatus Thermoplasmatota archaeon]
MSKDTLRVVTIVLLLGVAALAVAHGPGETGRGLPWPDGGGAPDTAPATAAGEEAAVAALHELRFEPNLGQAPLEALFVARGAQEVYVTATGVTAFAGAWVTLRFTQAAVPVLPEAPAGSHASYFLGDDPDAWLPSVPQYASVRLVGVAPGIDVVVHSQDGQLRFDHVLAPGADPRQAGFTVEGASRLSVTRGGELRLEGEGASLTLAPPYAYQDLPRGRTQVAAGFRPEGTRVFYEIGDHDPAHALVIDPVLRHATYLGGLNLETGNRIHVREGPGATRHLYIAGSRSSGTAVPAGFTPYEYPGIGVNVLGIPQLTLGAQDAFVMKLTYDYVTRQVTRDWIAYFGGTLSEDALAVTAAANGDVFVAGTTGSDNFPVKDAILDNSDNRGTFDGTVRSPPWFSANEAFVVRFSPDGDSLLMGTLIGSSATDSARGLAFDSAGRLIVVGDASNGGIFVTPFPVKNAAQPIHGDDWAKVNGGGTAYTATEQDAFILKLDLSGVRPTFVFSTFLGDRNNDVARAVGVDAQDNIYVTGYVSNAALFPGTAGSFKPTGSGFAAFVAKYSPTGQKLWATLLDGASTDEAFDIAVTPTGTAWVVGRTLSSNFPICGTAATAPCSATPVDSSINQQDAFVVAVDADGAGISYGSFLGSTGSGTSSMNDEAWAVAYDPAAGHVTVAGRTQAPDFVTNGVQPATQASKPAAGVTYNAFVVRIDPSSAAPLVFGTYLGGNSDSAARGVTVDNRGVTYVTGHTSTNFQTLDPVQATSGGSNDVFLAVYGKRPPTPVIEATPQGLPKVLAPPSTTAAFPSLTNLTLASKTQAGDLPVASLSWQLTGPAGPVWQASGPGGVVDGALLTPGDYTACLTATDTETRLPLADHEATTCLTLQVQNRAPTVTLQVPAGGATGAPVAVAADGKDRDGQVLSYQWDFGDGTVVSTASGAASHTYTTPGTYTVTVNVLDDLGLTAAASASIVVLRPPSASFTATQPAFQGFPVFFTDASVGGSLPIASWTWDFGDGTFEGRSPPPRVYAQPGTYPVKLTVANSVGSSTYTMQLLVKEARPSPVDDSYQTYRGTPLSVEAPGLLANDENPHAEALAVLVKANPTRGTLAWAADGSFSYAPAEGFVGVDTFTYTITGASVTGTVRVHVREFPAPNASFTAVEEGLVMAFTDTSTAGFQPIVAWEWDFGDGWRSLERNPSHSYRTSGKHLVTLTIVDAGGLSSTSWMVL